MEDSSSSPGLLGTGGKQMTHATKVERPGPRRARKCVSWVLLCCLLQASFLLSWKQVQETHWVLARVRRYAPKLSRWTSLEAWGRGERAPTKTEKAPGYWKTSPFLPALGFPGDKHWTQVEKLVIWSSYIIFHFAPKRVFLLCVLPCKVSSHILSHLVLTTTGQELLPPVYDEETG